MNKIGLHAPWLTVAMEEEALGVSASGTNVRILEYLATCEDLTSDELATDSTAWCAAFTNWCMLRAGLAGTGTSWARDWFDWGLMDDDPQPGSIVVWRRNAGPDGEGLFGHVSFLLEDRGENLLVLGGNQTQKVCRATYPKNGILNGDSYTNMQFRKPDI